MKENNLVKAIILVIDKNTSVGIKNHAILTQVNPGLGYLFSLTI